MITVEKAIAKVMASQAEAIINDSEDTPAWTIFTRIKNFRDKWETALDGKLDRFIEPPSPCPLKSYLELLGEAVDELKVIAQKARDGSMNPSLLRIAFGHIVFQGGDFNEDDIQDFAEIILISSMSENERLEFIDDEDTTQISQ